MHNKLTENNTQDGPTTEKECSLPQEVINDANSQHDIILPDCIDLDWAQISYAITHERLLFVNNVKTWSNFHNESGFKYIDFSPEEFCQRFLQHVLPNIYEYELNEDELHLLKLLSIHPHFQRTDVGFEVAPQTEILNFPANESTIETLMARNNFLRETSFVAGKVNSNDQIVLTDHRKINSLYHKFNFNAENAALLSVVLSTDEDLPNCELLTIQEIYKRLKVAKTRFVTNGQQLVNINISIEDLLDKLKTLIKLKAAVTELVDKSFRRQIIEDE